MQKTVMIDNIYRSSAERPTLLVEHKLGTFGGTPNCTLG